MSLCPRRSRTSSTRHSLPHVPLIRWLANAGYNLPGRRDASGAFKPEATRFAALHGAKVAPFDNRLGNVARARAVETLIAELGAGGGVEGVAIFCHGWRAGLQTGHRLRSAVRLADAITRVSSPSVRVVLYACSTGAAPDNEPGGDGGFADALRDALVARGCRGGSVDAHTVAGHATKTPYVRRFFAEPGVIGGEWLVEPKTKSWKPWRSRLNPTLLRFRFPFTSTTEIRSALAV